MASLFVTNVVPYSFQDFVKDLSSPKRDSKIFHILFLQFNKCLHIDAIIWYCKNLIITNFTEA